MNYKIIENFLSNIYQLGFEYKIIVIILWIIIMFLLLRKLAKKDNEFEAKHIKNAELRTYNSVWGHCVANPGNDKGFEIALDQAVNDLLE